MKTTVTYPKNTPTQPKFESGKLYIDRNDGEIIFCNSNNNDYIIGIVIKVGKGRGMYYKFGNLVHLSGNKFELFTGKVTLSND